MSNQQERHILLVEDNAAHAKLASLALTQGDLPCCVHNVTTASEAIAYLHENAAASPPTAPDLVILDLNLPDDATEVLHLLKHDLKLITIPVVVLTTSQSRGDFEKSCRLFANSHLIKPLDGARFRELMATLKHYWLSIHDQTI